MTDPTSPQAIAARLTPRQREALLWLPVDGTSLRYARERGPVIRGLAHRSVPLVSCHKQRYVGVPGATMIYTPNDLGRRVREEVARG